MMNPKKCNRKTLAAAIGMVMVGLGAASSAQATAIAFAENKITAFKITSSTALSITSGSTPVQNTVNFASYGPTGGISSGITFQNPVALGSISDALQATAGPGLFPAQNIYVPTPNIVGARGDSDTTGGSPLSVGGIPNINNVAEARVTTNLGTAGAGGGLNTSNFAITLNLGSAGTISFNFTDLYNVSASTTVAGETAQGTIANVFSITSASGATTGQTVFSYADTAININCASNSLIPPTCNTAGNSGFSGTSGTLLAGNYTIALLSSSAVTVTSVPEPGSILLFGLGLGAIGFTMRRRNEA